VVDPNAIHPSEFKESIPIGHRKRRRTKNKLKLQEKICILHQVVCKFRPQKLVAKEYRISPGYVSTIVKKV